uniref:non-specific serine/threonine protein kinase n=1 Tax=Oryza rufipogon TaxID=4529 RepID=A0A0E0R6X6_ORYRU
MATFCKVRKRDDGIYVLTLASSDGHHYLTTEAITQLKQALERIRSTKARGLVTTTTSGSFCDGINAVSDDDDDEPLSSLERGMAEVVRLLLDLPMPTAAAVRGDARWLGFVLALAHDHLFVHTEAVLGLAAAADTTAKPRRRPLPDYVVALLREKIPYAQLRKLLLLKAHVFTGEELKGNWHSVHEAIPNRDHNLQSVVVGDGMDYAKVRRTMYTNSCVAVAVTTTTTTMLPFDGSSSVANGVTISSEMTPSGESFNSSYNSSTTPVDISLAAIEACTDGFSESKKVGSGAYGKVYKGVYNEEELAFKKIDGLAVLNEDQFKNELKHLMSVQHRNIVRFVGYCSQIKEKFIWRGKEYVSVQYITRILCFEYLPGGSLDKHLDKESESDGFDWRTRYNIIKGISQGLNYLHELEKPIFHLDLKPANVLLDENMEPKIADFGISKHFTGTKTHITISKPTGTPFGVMVMEIIAGPTGYDNFSEANDQDSFKYIDRVYKQWEKRITAKSHDPSAEINQVKRCINIAVKCLNQNRDDRPEIKAIAFKVLGTRGSLQKTAARVVSRYRQSRVLNRQKKDNTIFGINCRCQPKCIAKYLSKLVIQKVGITSVKSCHISQFEDNQIAMMIQQDIFVIDEVKKAAESLPKRFPNTTQQSINGCIIFLMAKYFSKLVIRKVGITSVKSCHISQFEDNQIAMMIQQDIVSKHNPGYTFPRYGKLQQRICSSVDEGSKRKLPSSARGVSPQLILRFEDTMQRQ